MSSAPTVPSSPKTPDSQPYRLNRRVGRPAKKRLAFAYPARRPLSTGPPSRIAQITEDELSEILALCRRGTDPQTATIKILGVTERAFRKWRSEADTDDCDPRYLQFFSQVGQAFAACRSDASIIVTENDPLAALTRGPLGRSRPGYPGWTETHEVRHTDHTGEGDPVLRVRLNVGRYGISSEVIKQDSRALLTETEEESDGG